jgi:hypothetical protein
VTSTTLLHGCSQQHLGILAAAAAAADLLSGRRPGLRSTYRPHQHLKLRQQASREQLDHKAAYLAPGMHLAPNHASTTTLHLCHLTQRSYYLVPSPLTPRHCLNYWKGVMTYSLIATHTDAGLERIFALSISQSKLANGVIHPDDRASNKKYMHNIRGSSRRSSEGAGNEV